MQTSLTLYSAAINESQPIQPKEFTLRGTDASGVTTWDAESPQSDLVGSLVLTRQSQRTKANIVSRSLKLTVPIYDGTAAMYKGSIQARIVLNAPAAAPIPKVLEALNLLLTSFTGDISLFAIDSTSGSYVSDFIMAR